ncbi:MAG: hypothetical protein JWN69_2410 [Alphaproteobacteria bacterium]|nr:hypothetical protein [Alphaproteobacteria bacterium]
MASQQSQALTDMYRDWTARMGTGTMELPQIREMFEGWGALATEPENMEYAEINLGGVRCLRAMEKGLDDKMRVLLCFHGGGFVCGSVESHRKMFAHIAKALGCKAAIVDYDRTPDNPHPGILNQCVAAYADLLAKGYKPEHIAIIGDSAGGNLSIATLVLAKLLGYPMPAATVPLSPWLDMEPTAETMQTKADVDAFVAPDAVRFMASMYLGAGQDPAGPLASPLYADVSGLPPILIQVGGHEALLGDSERLEANARKAGVDVTLQVYPEMQHVFQLMAGKAPEADDAVAKIVAWLKPKLDL